MLHNWCFSAALWCFWAVGTEAASGSSTSADATTLVTSTSSTTSSATIHTIPLRAASGEKFFNAYVSDVALRLDLIQPDVWIPNPENPSFCQELYDYDTASYASVNASADSSSCVAYITSMYGALYTATTETTVVSASQTTETIVQVVEVSSETVDIEYPNGIVAEGELASADLYVVDNSGNELALDHFPFIYVNKTNMLAGGLGMASSPVGRGLLSYLYEHGKLQSRGYSALLSNSDYDSVNYGELLLGAVNKNHYSGSLYSFPVLPYEGLDSTSVLPTVLLSDLLVYNTNTSQSASLVDGISIPLLLDSRISYNSLPLEVIIRLALQTNAFYNSANDIWIVRCSDVENSDARLHYKFGPLTIDVPLSTLLMYSSNDTDLKFMNGDKACVLNVCPSSYTGYSSLGLPFLSRAYLVMDNDGGNIGLANKNTSYSFGSSIYSTYSNSSSSSQTSSISSTGNISASFIYSGSIPFATSVNTTDVYTLTFSSANTSAAEAILSRYSSASIISGEVIISNTAGSTTTSNRTSSKTSTAAAASLAFVGKRADHGGNVILYITILLLGALGGVLI